MAQDSPEPEAAPTGTPAPGGPLWDLRVAASFLTRLPLPIDHVRAGETFARCGWAFPVVGAGIGAAGGGVLWLAAGAGLGPEICALLALACMALLTGALHEDGLADLADGLGAADREKRLAIMADSRLGTYGALALIFSVGLRTAALASLPGPLTAAAALVAAGALSRAVTVPSLAMLPAARTGGLADRAGRPAAATALLALGLGVAAAIGGLLPVATDMGCLGTVAVSLVAGLFMVWAMWALLGGHTGDGLGAQQQVTETVLYLCLAVAMAAR